MCRLGWSPRRHVPRGTWGATGSMSKLHSAPLASLDVLIRRAAVGFTPFQPSSGKHPVKVLKVTLPSLAIAKSSQMDEVAVPTEPDSDSHVSLSPLPPPPPDISFEFVTGDVSPGWRLSNSPPPPRLESDLPTVAASSAALSAASAVIASVESFAESSDEAPAADDFATEEISSLCIEVAIPQLPLEQRGEFVDVYSQAVELVHEQLRDQGQTFYSVEFTDGRCETISSQKLSSLPNGKASLYRFANEMAVIGRKRKRSTPDDWDSEMDFPASDRMDMDVDEDDEDEDELNRPSSSLRVAKPSGRVLRSRDTSNRFVSRSQSFSSSDANGEDPVSKGRKVPPRELRTRQTRITYNFKRSSRRSHVDGERDELANEPLAPSDDDDDFMPVVSDIAVKVGRKSNAYKRRAYRSKRILARTTSRKGSNDTDIEFEAPRRSGRATRNMVDMRDDAHVDDDSFDGAVEKTPAIPKVVSVKEVFQTLSPDSAFSSLHIQTCHSCSGSRQQGQLIHCQGCSLSYHKLCLGQRSVRDHVVTKIGDDEFVLQCRYCIDIYRKRGKKEHAAAAPRHSACQSCKIQGLACKPFSEKKTARQEEKLREENGGTDPVTPVSRELINNLDAVLFRCVTCHRGWHLDHLSAAGKEAVVGTDFKSERLKDYAVDWQCNECSSAKHKVQRLVAWRPSEPSDCQLSTQPLYDLVGEDDKEYLIKWQGLSYAHCSWMPGAWVFGVCASGMIKAFAKRAEEPGMLKLTTADAVPDEYLMPDIIFSLKMAPGAPKSKTKEAGIANISYVSRVLVKYQGLGYDDVTWDSPPSPDLTTRYAAFKDAYLDYLKGKHFFSEPNAKIRERVKSFKATPFKPVAEQPAGLVRGKLMGYQLEGLNWLLGNYHDGRSVVLADEMGLGKTIQVISLVTSLVQDSPKCWPFLIAVPNSTCPNWRREFKQWAPGLRVVTYHGGREPQELAYQHELFPNKSLDMKAHVVIMSYDSAQDPKTKNLFRSVHWAGLVVDEGQRLKNDQNLLYLGLRALRIPFRLLLTGTPLQNNKRELFNLLQFIDETQNAAALDEQYQVLDKETLPKLHDKIRPYFLRRTKLGVLKFLPPMAQIILPVTMTVIQEKLAKSIMAKNPQLIKSIFANNKLTGKDRGSLNNILMQLRKCLCHPFMYSEAIEERNHDPTALHQNLVEASAKLLLLDVLLPKLKERGHRVLIFSQFLQQLDILEDFLSGVGYQYGRLDGSMSSLEKQRRIDAFNAPDSSLFAFLLSTRAGGVGINLATADTVIIMDPDFNPHQDIQALSRAHRIGQKKKVLCFQLMTKDTAEERIMEIGRKKMALDHALIESMDDDQLAGDDLESILRHGAQALFDEKFQKSAIHYDEQSVIDLLDGSQAEQTKTDEGGSAETQFSYARVWANEKGGFSEGLDTAEDVAPEPISSSVWDKILAQREEEARQEAEANKEVLGRGGRRRMAINYKANAIDGVLPEAIGPDSSDASDEFAGANSSDDSDEEKGKGQAAKGKGRKPPRTPLKSLAAATPVKKKDKQAGSKVDTKSKQRTKTQTKSKTRQRREEAEEALPTPGATPVRTRTAVVAADKKKKDLSPSKNSVTSSAKANGKQPAKQIQRPGHAQQADPNLAVALPANRTVIHPSVGRLRQSGGGSGGGGGGGGGGGAGVVMGNGHGNQGRHPYTEVQLRLTIDEIWHSKRLTPQVKQQRIEGLLHHLRALHRDRPAASQRRPGQGKSAGPRQNPATRHDGQGTFHVFRL
ncbi:hypothetical protein L249_5077 [Ophiocordyceps polyrhachis-furcata BCC 54312]|uniref:PHD-type domain-containing protein n=1 Tax=Ophiocordyceps polyrhachis-furcata BCC 54312 TaxID=1330021 RepID=A0A367L3H2_9HYPO|nr:hypothetical protein L249_5077 [Ophiocordyceps polyrhachis-furcata BCC 54312]